MIVYILTVQSSIPLKADDVSVFLDSQEAFQKACDFLTDHVHFTYNNGYHTLLEEYSRNPDIKERYSLLKNLLGTIEEYHPEEQKCHVSVISSSAL
jgi:ADP-dependent phosphofructokinase/glucokinase